MLSTLKPPSQLLKIRPLYSHAFHITLYKDDVESRLLSPTGWLDDQIINFYLKLLSDRSENSPSKASCYPFSTFFFPKLSSQGFQSVSKWTKKIKLFSFDVAVVPVHLKAEKHWCIASIHFKQRKILFYDSLEKFFSEGETCMNTLLQYLEQESNDKFGGRAFDRSKWSTEFLQNFPQQKNGSDCGVYVCQYAKHLSGDTNATEAFKLSSEKTHYIRQQMGQEIKDLKIAEETNSITKIPHAFLVHTVPHLNVICNYPDSKIILQPSSTNVSETPLHTETKHKTEILSPIINYSPLPTKQNLIKEETKTVQPNKLQSVAKERSILTPIRHSENDKKPQIHIKSEENEGKPTIWKVNVETKVKPEISSPKPNSNSQETKTKVQPKIQPVVKVRDFSTPIRNSPTQEIHIKSEENNGKLTTLKVNAETKVKPEISSPIIVSSTPKQNLNNQETKTKAQPKILTVAKVRDFSTPKNRNTPTQEINIKTKENKVISTSGSHNQENANESLKETSLPSELAEDELSDCFQEPNPGKQRNKSFTKSKKQVVTSEDELEPDKKTNKEWDIKGINDETCKILKESLPSYFECHIVAAQPYEVLHVENNDHNEEDIDDDLHPLYKNEQMLPTFTAVIRLNIRTKEDAFEWLEQYMAASFTDWRSAKTFKENSPFVKFKKQFKCHHDTGASNPSCKTKTPHIKHTKCQSRLMITIKNFEMKRSSDLLLKSFPCEIRIRHWHNHRLRSCKTLKHRRPTPYIRELFQDMFQKGHSPSSALQSHKFDLQLKYGSQFYQAHGDGAECPSIKWCYYQYYKQFKKCYGDNYGVGMIEKLRSAIDEYNEASQKICANMHHDGNDLLVVLCSPMMQRVHENWRSSGEIVFMDFSGGMDRYDSRVGVLATPSIAGGLPLGIIITTSESELLITTGLHMLHDIFPKDSAFHGKGRDGPELFLTDDSAAERNSLRNTYSLAILLLCIFHVLQAFLRYVTDSKHLVKKEHRCHAVDMLKKLVYAASEEEFEECYEEMMQDDVVKNNEFLTKHLKEDLYPRAREWALCYRKDLRTRGNHTNNYVECMFRLLKDIIFQRVKAFNIVQLFDFLVTRLNSYLECRIAGVLNDRAVNVSLKYRPVKPELLKNLTATHVVGKLYRVINKTSGGDYVVDMEVDICSCFKGNGGGQCKHQYLVAKQFNIATPQFQEFMDEAQRMALHKIMTGDVDVPDGWYADMKDLRKCPTSIPTEDGETETIPDQNVEDVPVEAEAKIKETDKQDEQTGAIARCKENLQRVFERFNTALDKKPEESLPALTEFCKMVEAQKTDTSLFSALFVTKKLKRKGKDMNVSSEAIRRRTAHLGGRKLQQTGRPPKAAFVPQHAYDKPTGRAGPLDPAPTKPKPKMPHSFGDKLNALRYDSYEPPCKKSKKSRKV